MASVSAKKWIVVETGLYRLRYYEEGVRIHSYRIGIGREATPTPTGNYHIYQMCENPKKVYREGPLPIEVFGSRCIELSLQAFDFDLWVWRNYSIHGTDDERKIGTRCSAGCVIMNNKDIREIYEKLDVGDPVIIV